MATNIPSSHPTIDLPQYAAGQDIDSDDIVALLRADARRFSWHGTRSMAVIYDPEWTTTSTTYTAANGLGGSYAEDLDERWGGAIPVRPVQADAGEYLYIVEAFLIQCTIKASIVEHGGSALDTVEITNAGATYAHASGILNPTVGGFLFNSRDDAYLQLEGKATSGTGKIQQITIHEGFLTASDLPKRQ